ncbi:MAG TPA: hypothetical protein VMP08_08265, partial [Anaerolineae bacterium]|nr:hypothetical protein [Anaerolineae bacterium]
RGLDARVLAYSLQGVVFPFAALLASSLSGTLPATLTVLYAALWLVLILGVWRWQGKHVAGVSTLWLLAGLLPVVIGLSWSYTRIGARLLYPAALGVAMLWGGWLVQVFAPQMWRRAIGLVTMIGLVWCSIAQWSAMREVYEQGTHYLAETITRLAQQPDQSILLVNYPDRLWLRPAPYPLGEWGLILAPVVQDVSDYAVAQTGHSAATQSLSVFRVGADQRGAYPYDVFMRGEDTPLDKLVEAAAQVDRVWITAYAPDGDLTLREAGSIQRRGSSAYRAQFGEVAQLLDAQINGSTIDLTWRALAPLRTDDTIFVHLWRDGAFAAAFDGDSLSGLVPPSNWPLDKDVVDVRSIETRDLPPGQYEVRVGLYNRNDGARYTSVDAQGQPAYDGEVTIGTMDVR